MKKLSILLIIMFIISSFIVAGYSRLGGDNQDFIISGRGNFDLGNILLSPSIKTKTIHGEFENSILYEDIDGDGNIEIIILTSTQIQIYRYRNLTPVSFISHGCTGKISNMVIQDLNVNNNKELIIDCPAQDKIKLFNLTSNILNLQKEITHSRQSTAIQSQIGCNSSNTCFVMNQKLDYSNSGNELHIQMFDYNNIYYTSGGAIVADYQHGLCPVDTLGLVINDIDNDGKEEILVSLLGMHPSGYVSANILVHECVSAGCTLEFEVSIGTPMSHSITETCEELNLSHYATIPLVYDFSTLVNKEVVFGVQTAESEFKLYMYDSLGNLIDDYPEIFHGDGKLISNPFVANVFPDSDYSDFCVLGYENDSGNVKLDLICGSESTDTIPKTKTFFVYLDGVSELDISPYSHEMMSHSVQMKYTPIENADLSEILTSYGIFEIDYDWINELNLIYSNAYGGTVLAGDIEQSGLNDILIVNTPYLYYLDDGFINRPVEILGSSTVNPAYTSIWKINTSVHVNLYLNEPEGDTVCTNGFLYYGTEYQQNFTQECSTESTRLFYFTADTRISNGILRLIANDTVNRQEQVLEIPFTVDYEGISFGDSISTIYDLVEDDEDENDYLPMTDTKNNSITKAMAEITTASGFGTISVVLFLMVFIAYLIISTANSNGWKGGYTFGLLSISEISLLFFATVQGWIGTGLIMGLSVISIVIIGISLSKFFNNSEA